MKSKYGRTIHAFRSSGVNAPGYSRAPQPPQAVAQPPAEPQPPAATQRPSTARTAPQRPQDAKTVEEAMAGLWRATSRIGYIHPRFSDTKGSWVRVGSHQCRTPQNSIVSVIRSRDGREFGIVAGTNANDGQIWILADTPGGIRELYGLPPGALSDIRKIVFGLG